MGVLSHGIPIHDWTLLCATAGCTRCFLWWEVGRKADPETPDRPYEEPFQGSNGLFSRLALGYAPSEVRSSFG